MIGDVPANADRLYKLPYSAVLNPFLSEDPDLEKAYDALQTADDATLRGRREAVQRGDDRKDVVHPDLVLHALHVLQGRRGRRSEHTAAATSTCLPGSRRAESATAT